MQEEQTLCVAHDNYIDANNKGCFYNKFYKKTPPSERYRAPILNFIAYANIRKKGFSVLDPTGFLGLKDRSSDANKNIIEFYPQVEDDVPIPEDCFESPQLYLINPLRPIKSAKKQNPRFELLFATPSGNPQ